MTKLTTFLLATLFVSFGAVAQEVIPIDNEHWDIEAKSHVFENYKGKDAIYLQQGVATLKGTKFLNGTIEFDVYLTERQSFPGVYFRSMDDDNAETFFLRPHLSGKPDANQAAPVINGLVAWQLYFGPSYSFAYTYKFDDWTHVKLVINDRRGQVYLDFAEKPHLSWNLKHPPREGELAIGGSFAPMHYADFKINKDEKKIIDFNVSPIQPVDGIVPEWEISDKFEEELLSDPKEIRDVIESREWGKKIRVEENNVANISQVASLRGGKKGNTVFARLKIESEKDQLKLFEFGYSDRVVAILNGKAIYRGTNRWRTRDYRYLGTVGLFDAIYLDLKAGENTLLLAVSEDFGGWGVTGRFEDNGRKQVEKQTGTTND